MKCPYCNSDAEVVTGLDIYPHRKDLKNIKIYRCVPCDARVGTHKKSGKPLGTLANKELREARKEAHSSFDPLWKSGDITRREAYKRLSGWLGIPFEDTHIARFDIKTCAEVVKFAESKL